MRKSLFISLFILFFLQTQAHAKVLFVENEKAGNKSTTANPLNSEDVKKKIQHQKKQPKFQQYEIDGYSDSKYVRFVVDVSRDNLVMGRMIEKKGPGRAVHGEFIDGVLHLYDRKGKHFTVIMPE